MTPRDKIDAKGCRIVAEAGVVEIRHDVVSGGVNALCGDLMGSL